MTIADRYIYVMGGYEPSVTDIERLDTESGDQPFWELIKVWSQSFENDIKFSSEKKVSTNKIKFNLNFKYYVIKSIPQFS